MQYKLVFLILKKKNGQKQTQTNKQTTQTNKQHKQTNKQTNKPQQTNKMSHFFQEFPTDANPEWSDIICSSWSCGQHTFEIQLNDNTNNNSSTSTTGVNHGNTKSGRGVTWSASPLLAVSYRGGNGGVALYSDEVGLCSSLHISQCKT